MMRLGLDGQCPAPWCAIDLALTARARPSQVWAQRPTFSVAAPTANRARAQPIKWKKKRFPTLMVRTGTTYKQNHPDPRHHETLSDNGLPTFHYPAVGDHANKASATKIIAAFGLTCHCRPACGAIA